MDPLEALNEIAKTSGGKITEVGILSDNSGFAIMSMPLRKDHWIYDCGEENFNTPPMVFRMGSKEKAMLIIGQSDDSNDAGLDSSHGITMNKEAFRQKIREAGKYAVRCATMNGKEMDFDPDALLQNLVVGFLGYFTEDGLSSDDFANPPELRK